MVSYRQGAARPAALLPGRDVKPLLVDRHRYDPRLGGAENLDCCAVARVLDPGGGAGIEQQPHGKAQPLLRPRRHDDLFRLAAHPARGGKIIGDRPAQRQLALRVAIVPDQTRTARQGARGEPLPGRDKAGVDLGMAGLERPRRAAKLWAVVAQPLTVPRQRTRCR